MNALQSKLTIVSTTMQETVLDAIETHRRMGRSIVIMEDGQIKHIKAKDLRPRPLPGDEPDED